jgi:hypothetical protein
MYSQWRRDGKINNWRAVAGSAAGGAVTGGMAGLTLGASVAVSAVGLGLASAAGGITNDIVQGQQSTAESVISDFAVGTAVGVANQYVGGVLNKVFAGNAEKLNAFIKSASSPDKNGLTMAGRALQKHAGREGSSFSNIKFSGKTANEDGLNVVKSILNAENKVVQNLENGTTNIFDKATGRGVNISRDGKFNGFRDLKNINE